ncbi:MAG: type II toxin-antitoxin system RelE/ParE family toxin [Candidatus Omnitrophica bacterium]|nr:type II toxin-antitoxin system RelE/ParE family toxin [Candidatus Omnitrophota bacterium]MCK5591574.1 type II toxin-antitoxin system RelE/ParE family toxin [Candidatus Paceibacterota bacterium]
MERSTPIAVNFYKTESGNEPTREWLSSLKKDYTKAIGEDVKTVQFGWPLGMPLVKKIEPNLWEVRTKLKDGFARIIFTMVDEKIIIVHGFMKKSNKMPKSDLELARKRMKMVRG